MVNNNNRDNNINGNPNMMQRDTSLAEKEITSGIPTDFYEFNTALGAIRQQSQKAKIFV